MMKFWVYFTNHGYYCEQKFERLSDAIAYGQGLHSEFAVHYRKPDGTFELVAVIRDWWNEEMTVDPMRRSNLPKKD